MKFSDDKIEIALACTGKYRIPEPLRRADFISKIIKKDLLASEM